MWEGRAEGQSGETDNTTIIFRDFNTPLLIMDRTNGQKINKEIENLNNTISQLDLTDIYLWSIPPNSRIHIVLKLL